MKICKNCIHWKACKDTTYGYAASAYDEDGCCKMFAEICENYIESADFICNHTSKEINYENF